MSMLTRLREHLTTCWASHGVSQIYAVIVSIIIAIVIIGIGDRREAVKVTAHHFISDPPIFAGSNVQVEWSVIDLRNGWTGQSCGGTVYIIWIDSLGRRHPYTPFSVPIHEVREGMEQTFTAPRIVPFDMPPGDAVYTVFVDRYCNPLQWLFPMRDKLPEVKFTVSPSP